MSPLTRVTKFAASTIAATGIALALMMPASAHVGITPANTDAGAYTLLTFGVPHGCDGSATTKVAIQIPDQFTTVTPGVNYGWNVEKVTKQLDEPVDNGHGGEYTERVSEVVYTAKEPLPADLYDSFVMSLKLPEDAAGETIYFPVIQTCEEGETAWIQIPEAGQDGHDLENPAPSVTVTEPAA